MALPPFAESLNPFRARQTCNWLPCGQRQEANAGHLVALSDTCLRVTVQDRPRRRTRASPASMRSVLTGRDVRIGFVCRASIKDVTGSSIFDQGDGPLARPRIKDAGLGPLGQQPPGTPDQRLVGQRVESDDTSAATANASSTVPGRQPVRRQTGCPVLGHRGSSELPARKSLVRMHRPTLRSDQRRSPSVRVKSTEFPSRVKKNCQR